MSRWSNGEALCDCKWLRPGIPATVAWQDAKGPQHRVTAMVMPPRGGMIMAMRKLG